MNVWIDISLYTWVKLSARGYNTELQGFEGFCTSYQVVGLWSLVFGLNLTFAAESAWPLPLQQLVLRCLLRIAGVDKINMRCSYHGSNSNLDGIFTCYLKGFWSSGKKMEQKVFHKQFLKERAYRKPPILEQTLVIKNCFCNTTCCSKLFLPPSLDLHSP